MRVGIDFDNTIVNYDGVFWQVALSENLIMPDVPKSKIGVRDYLRKTNKESEWTALQGKVYGKHIHKASLFEDCFETIDYLITNCVEVFIVSHKTKHPYLGEKYDLHHAATEWIEYNLKKDNVSLIQQPRISFNATLEDKIKTISELGLDIFIDDLLDVFNHHLFPVGVRKILFGSSRKVPIPSVTVCSHWRDVFREIEKYYVH